jgi:hypothetical protein
VTLVKRAFVNGNFAYPRFYFSITRSFNVIPTASVVAVARVHWAARAVSRTLPVLRVFDICADSQQYNPRV